METGKALLRVLFNQTFVTLFLSIIISELDPKVGFPDFSILPTFSQFCIDMFVFHIAREILFYYSHRSVDFHFGSAKGRPLSPVAYGKVRGTGSPAQASRLEPARFLWWVVIRECRSSGDLILFSECNLTCLVFGIFFYYFKFDFNFMIST